MIDRSRIGCSTITFRKFPLETALTSIASLDLQWVDIASMPHFAPHFSRDLPLEEETARVRELLDISRLKARTFNVDIGPYLENMDAALHLTDRFVRAARMCGAPLVTLGSARLPTGQSITEAMRETTARFHRAAAELAAAQGVRLALETPYFGAIVGDAPEAQDNLRRIDHPAATIAYDTAHNSRGSLPMSESARRLAPHITHVHLRDHDGNANVYPLGAGQVPFADFFRTMKEVGYEGVYSLEFADGADSPEGMVDLARTSLLYLAKL
jgi:sugar phosphate isomerase/epimerase